MVNMLNNKVKSDVNWKTLFVPDSVAVIGASNVPATWGYNITWRLLNCGKRSIYPVNPFLSEVQGVPAWDSVLSIPATVDLAIIAVPAKQVAMVLQQCGRKGIKTAVIISGGFGETGEEGALLQDEIVRVADEAGIRFIGPNTMGHFNNPAQFSILAWAGETDPGRVALVSQSGNSGSRILTHGKAVGVGFSKFVCTGNEASLCLEDYLEFLAQDDDSAIITSYIEGLRQARRFYELAREITLRKPIVVLKSGGTGESARAARSHTGALAGSDAVYRAAFRQAGVIQADTDDELLDVVIALLHQPLPRGNRIGIITIGGGLGVVATEACERAGLVMAPLSAATMEKLNALLPARWSHANPVDTVGISAIVDNQLIMLSLWALLEDDNIDAVLLQAPVVFAPGFIARIFHFNADEVRAFDEKQRQNLTMFRERVEKHQKPVFVITPVNDPETTSYTLQEKIPIYPSPHRAARALRHLAWYRRYLDTHRR